MELFTKNYIFTVDFAYSGDTWDMSNVKFHPIYVEFLSYFIFYFFVKIEVAYNFAYNFVKKKIKWNKKKHPKANFYMRLKTMMNLMWKFDLLVNSPFNGTKRHHFQICLGKGNNEVLSVFGKTEKISYINIILSSKFFIMLH